MQMLSQLSQRYGYQSPNFQKPDEIASTYDDVKAMLADQKAAREAQAKQIIGQGLLGQAQANADAIKAKIAQLQAMQAAEQNPATKETLQAQIDAAMAQLQKIQMQGAEGFADPMRAIDRSLGADEQGSSMLRMQAAQEQLQKLANNKIEAEAIRDEAEAEVRSGKTGEQAPKSNRWSQLYTDYMQAAAKFPNAQGQLNAYRIEPLTQLTSFIKKDIESDAEKEAKKAQMQADRAAKEKKAKEDAAYRSEALSLNKQRLALQAKALNNTITQQERKQLADNYDRTKALQDDAFVSGGVLKPEAYDSMVNLADNAKRLKSAFALVKIIGQSIEPKLAVNDSEAQAWMKGDNGSLYQRVKADIAGASEEDVRKLHVIATDFIKSRQVDSKAIAKRVGYSPYQSQPSGNILKDMSNKGGGANTGTPAKRKLSVGGF